MRSRLSILLLLYCSATGSAQAAEDWMVIPTTSPDITFSIDKNSVERDGPRIKFREKLTYAKPEKRDEVSGRLIAEKRMHQVLNCNDKTVGLIQGATYNENGRFIASISVDEAKIFMVPIPPNTIASRELALLCEPADASAAPAEKQAVPTND